MLLTTPTTQKPAHAYDNHVNKTTKTAPQQIPPTPTSNPTPTNQNLRYQPNIPSTWPFGPAKTHTTNELRTQRRYLNHELSNNIYLNDTQRELHENELYRLDTLIAARYGAQYTNHPLYGGNSWGYLPIDNPDEPLTTNPTWIINHGAYEVGRLVNEEGTLLLDGQPINKKDNLWYGTAATQTIAATVWANRKQINKKLHKLGYSPVYETEHEHYPTINFTLEGNILKGRIQPTEGQNENIVPFMIKVRVKKV